MQINRLTRADVAVLTVDGRLDATTALPFEQALTAELQTGTARLIIDLARVQLISSAALRVLVSAAKQAKRQGGQIVVCALTREVAKVFEISGLASLFRLEPTVADALAALGVPADEPPSAPPEPSREATGALPSAAPDAASTPERETARTESVLPESPPTLPPPLPVEPLPTPPVAVAPPPPLLPRKTLPPPPPLAAPPPPKRVLPPPPIWPSTPPPPAVPVTAKAAGGRPAALLPVLVGGAVLALLVVGVGSGWFSHKADRGQPRLASVTPLPTASALPTVEEPVNPPDALASPTPGPTETTPGPSPSPWRNRRNWPLRW